MFSAETVALYSSAWATTAHLAAAVYYLNYYSDWVACCPTPIVRCCCCCCSDCGCCFRLTFETAYFLFDSRCFWRSKKKMMTTAVAAVADLSETEQ